MAPPNLVINPGTFFKITTVTTIVAGTVFLMWLGEQITQRGIGNGISLIIFSGIVAEIPRALVTTFELGRTGALSTVMIISIFILLSATIMFIVFIERALRKILINYPKRQMGNKMYGGDSSHLPLKINQAGVIPAIFASAEKALGLLNWKTERTLEEALRHAWNWQQTLEKTE